MNERKNKQEAAKNWFEALRDRLCQAFEALEKHYCEQTGIGTPGTFSYTPWDHTQEGGGVMGLMRGQVFEKVGVNVSTVHGTFSPTFAQEIPGASEDPSFWASGISLVAHMKNPFVPAVHMNTRMICTQKTWFGGGADLTPTYPFDEDTAAFHGALKEACDLFNPDYYAQFKKWCDTYFFLPHRNEMRGVGGIFYDYLDSGDWTQDFSFTQSIGEAFLSVYPSIVENRMFTDWNENNRLYQLKKRGRYVEFNLLYDRGTRFGLQTNGNVEAILMSLPPEVHWP